MITIKEATISDIDAVTKIETVCFPPEQAASRESLKERLEIFGKHFLIAIEEGKVIGYIGGMVSDKRHITDEMYDNASQHKEDGAYQMVFSLAVLPECRHKKIAQTLMQRMMQKARREGRIGISLTCLEYLIGFYESMGFQNQGVSASIHGDAVWYDMYLEV